MFGKTGSWLLVGVAAAASSCPPVSSITEQSVVRREFIFYSPPTGRLVSGVAFYPRQSAPAAQPAVVHIPGFLDTSRALEYLAEAEAQAGFYAVVFDPDDYINLFPQRGKPVLEIDPVRLWFDLRRLEQTLLATGYDLEADDWRSLLLWLYAAFGGQEDEESILLICQAVFDHRLAEAEVLLAGVVGRQSYLPGWSLIDPERVFVVGHSLGGFNAAELAGAGRRSRLPAGLIKGAVLLAPATGAFRVADIEMITVPTCWLIASEDSDNINQPAELHYPLCPEPKEWHWFQGYGHEDFSGTFQILKGSEPERVVAVSQTVINFLNRYR